MYSKLFLFGSSHVSNMLGQSSERQHFLEAVKGNCRILFKVRGLQWHSAMRIKLTVADFFLKLDYCSSFGQRCWLGFMSVPRVLLTIIAKQSLEMISILLCERITSC